MARRTVHLHLGLECSGGGFLEPALLTHAEALAAEGITVPAASSEEMFRAAVEIRRLHKDFGLKRREVEGTWVEIARRIGRKGGPVVLSHELLAGADAGQAALLLDALAGHHVHLVLTARDPGAQLTTAWIETLKAGGTDSLGRFAEHVLGGEGQPAEAFWQAQDLETVLARWRAIVPPERIHVLPVPPADDPRQLVWEEFGRLVGFDGSDLPLGARAIQPGLGATEVAVLRGVNQAVDRRIGGPLRRMVVKRYFAERVLGDLAAGTLQPPPEWHDALVHLGTAWQEVLATGGYDVRGRLADLLPPPPAAYDAPVTRADRLRATTDALAEVLVEVARLREHAEHLETRLAKLERPGQ